MVIIIKYGKVRLITKDDEFYADIISAEVHESGKYLPVIHSPQHIAREEEKIQLVYDKLIVESYDIDKDDEILSAEIDELYIDMLTDQPEYKITYGLDLDILSKYYDSQAGCMVMEVR